MEMTKSLPFQYKKMKFKFKKQNLTTFGVKVAVQAIDDEIN